MAISSTSAAARPQANNPVACRSRQKQVVKMVHLRTFGWCPGLGFLRGLLRISALNEPSTAELGPMFQEALVATSWREREARLARAYEMIARQHNELQITEPIDEKVSEHGRHYLILRGHRFGAAIFRKITSEKIRRIGFFGGSVSQLVESDHEVSNVQLCRKLRILYE